MPGRNSRRYKETELDTGKRTSADAFGTREFLNGNYLDRMSGAVLGIYGNSKDEAIYPALFRRQRRESRSAVPTATSFASRRATFLRSMPSGR